jgi:hypothetical protein
VLTIFGTIMNREKKKLPGKGGREKDEKKKSKREDPPPSLEKSPFSHLPAFLFYFGQFADSRHAHRDHIISRVELKSHVMEELNKERADRLGVELAEANQVGIITVRRGVEVTVFLFVCGKLKIFISICDENTNINTLRAGISQETNYTGLMSCVK